MGKKIKENLQDVWLGIEFFNLTAKTRFIKGKIAKFDLIKIKNICYMKNSVKRIKRKTTVWEKIFASHISNRGLVYEIYKELSKFNSKKTRKI